VRALGQNGLNGAGHVLRGTRHVRALRESQRTLTLGRANLPRVATNFPTMSKQAHDTLSVDPIIAESTSMPPTEHLAPRWARP
jgi:hypothetical protein